MEKSTECPQTRVSSLLGDRRPYQDQLCRALGTEAWWRCQPSAAVSKAELTGPQRQASPVPLANKSSGP